VRARNFSGLPQPPCEAYVEVLALALESVASNFCLHLHFFYLLARVYSSASSIAALEYVHVYTYLHLLFLHESEAGRRWGGVNINIALI